MQLMLVYIKLVSNHRCTFLKILMPMLYLKLRLALEARYEESRYYHRTLLNMAILLVAVVVIVLNVVWADFPIMRDADLALRKL